MNIKQIRALAKIAQESGLSMLEVSEGEMLVRIERGVQCAPQAPAAAQAISAPAPEIAQPREEARDSKDSKVNFNRVHEIKSQMVGVFYAAPGPDAKPFVSIGDKVKKGDVVCIVEAMKLMNEIVSDADGEVVDICASNGEVVEFGQTLFKVC